MFAMYPLEIEKKIMRRMKISSEWIRIGSGCFCVMLQRRNAGTNPHLSIVRRATSFGLSRGLCIHPERILPI